MAALPRRGVRPLPRRHVRRRVPAGADRRVRRAASVHAALAALIPRPRSHDRPARRGVTNRCPRQRSRQDLRAVTVPAGLEEEHGYPRSTWVDEDNTLGRPGMTVEEKVGQLFFNLFHFGADTFSGTELTNAEILAKYHIGGARYHGGSAAPGAGAAQLAAGVQRRSRCWSRRTANPAATAAATRAPTSPPAPSVTRARSEEVPFRTGLVSAREAGALGVNVNFAPIVDILVNWRNTIVNTRAHGTTADRRDPLHRRQGPRAARGGRGPGGVHQALPRRRDGGARPAPRARCQRAHASRGVGRVLRRVYAHHIAEGVEMIMAGHIALPEYSKKARPVAGPTATSCRPRSRPS